MQFNHHGQAGKLITEVGKLITNFSQFLARRIDTSDLYLKLKIYTSTSGLALSPDLPEAKFAIAFDKLAEWSMSRNIDLTLKLKRKLNIGIEKKLRALLPNVNLFMYSVIKNHREEITRPDSMQKNFG
ncbi:protein MpCYP704-like17 [Marchantia polymorpha subsp. ruderalis]